MIALKDLRYFIEAKNIDGERHEIRAHILAQAETVAAAIETTPETLAERVETVDDDEALAIQLLATIKNKQAEQRERRQAQKCERAQLAAAAVAVGARWVGDQLHFDVQALLAGALTRRNDLLTFVGSAFSVSVYMKPLLAVAQLKKRNLSAYADAKGVHIRWSTGGLNLCPQHDCYAEQIVVSVRSAAEQAA